MVEISDILVAIENKEHFILDEFIREGTFLRTQNGEFQRYVGGFTAVFPVEINREKWAFRCWHANMGDVRHRFEKIASAISNSKAEYLCEFAYTDEGILINGKRYPTTRMRWVEGLTIKEYICANANDANKLNALSKRFLSMIQDMHQLGFAHGDLQHGNIIVDKNGVPFLVDYDSFYCPELKGEKDIITGLDDYQHPSRKHNLISNEKLDYFSELIIYLSIVAISENPSLVSKYKVDASERMLFEANDYANLENSEIYRDLSRLSPTVQQLLDVLTRYLSHSSLSDLQSFDIVLDQMSFKASKQKLHAGKGEKVTLTWDVKNAENCCLIYPDGTNHSHKNKDSVVITPNETSKYVLRTTALDKKTVIDTPVIIEVYPDADVQFSSDKEYVFPSIPFTIFWQIKNAKRVALNGKIVRTADSITFTDGIEKNTTYTLSVTDEFGEKDYPLTIKMLPIPQIKTILVPTPKLENNLSITVQQPRINADVKFPKISMPFANMEIPYVPSLSDLGLDVKLSLPRRNFSILRSIKRIKRLFNHIIKK